MVVERRLGYIEEVRRRGYLDRLLLSHDNCALSHLVSYGNTGYGYLPTAFLQRLRHDGYAEDELRQLFVDNPVAAVAVDS